MASQESVSVGRGAKRPAAQGLDRPVTRMQKRLAGLPLDPLQEPASPSEQCSLEQHAVSSAPSSSAGCGLQLSLYVRWFSPGGKTKVNHLQLKPIDDIDNLEGISRNLVARAFPEHDRPDYLTSQDFYKFTPTDEFMSLPGDIARTEFRLVLAREGWEYTVLERELGAHRDPARKMLVTVIEFESTALMVGQLGVRVSLISYPVVSVKKSFLEEVKKHMEDPSFQGIL